MNPDTYQHLAARTECNQFAARERLAEYEPNPLLPVRLNHAVVGLTGEVGELAATIEHWVYYGQTFDVPAFIEELGDCLWYIALAANALGISLASIMEANIAKLQARYPHKYSDAHAAETNRDRGAEMKAMEIFRKEYRD